jgi:hypothetical protein
VHFTRSADAPGDPPAGGWLDRETNRRVPASFPVGLPSEVPDPEIESFRDRLLGRASSASRPPIASGLVEITERWNGDPLKAIAGQPPIALAPSNAIYLYWIAALTSDSQPRFEAVGDAEGSLDAAGRPSRIRRRTQGVL